MIQSHWVRRALAVLLVGTTAAPVVAQSPPSRFKNLKVLPQDITQAGIDSVMGGFTRALGVRCIHCHVGEEGKPFKREDFALDDKATKIKARAMLQMTRDINEKYIAALETHATPPIQVGCFTCHHGAPLPRSLQDILLTSYETGGIDSTLSRYGALRNRYYGAAAYDFGEVPLADVGTKLSRQGHSADALRLQTLNVEMNPKSAFAKRRYANAAIGEAFRTQTIPVATDTLRALSGRLGTTVVTEDMLNDVGYQLLEEQRMDPAIAVFQINATDHPKSGNAYDSLAEAYARKGDKKLAIENYTKSVALDSTNTHAKQQIDELRGKGGSKKTKGKS
jgi:tetratricopeptide (TPR) repeat protein